MRVPEEHPMKKALFAVVLSCALAAACGGEESSGSVEHVQPLAQAPFGTMPDGKAVELITLKHRNGTEVRIITLGGIILSLRTPDRAGAFDDIVLGFDQAAPYLDKSPYFGCIIGRYCNRIAKGMFTLDGTTYTLATNNGPNHLHGGVKGWDKVLWTPAAFQDKRGVGVTLRYTSPDGEEGYPGTVQAEVTYTLNDQGQLVVDYRATTDKPTIINMTQHSYFNLGGAQAKDILGHQLTINADRFTPIDATSIPTGEHAAVAGTPFDFTTTTAIGARIDQDHPQLKNGLGYDHNYVVRQSAAGALTEAARIVEPVTGRTLTIASTEPGIQFYSGNFLDGTITGKGGRVYTHRSGFCLEPQHYPDSPNRPDWPSTVLRPGQEYTSQTVFTFGVSK
jgi:aldose 1-epimerase